MYRHISQFGSECTFMTQVRKAILPVAGLGTRFLPATKSVPKELLPIVDKPILLYIVEEAVQAGIKDIILITDNTKSAIKDFFQPSPLLEEELSRRGKLPLLNRLRDIQDLAHITLIPQNGALGLGHAIWQGRKAVGKEPFAVLLGDELMAHPPCTTQTLIDTYEKTKISTVAIMYVELSQVSKYGIVDVDEKYDGLFKINHIVEKPDRSSSPSQWALPGRYVFHPEIFDLLENIPPGQNGEVQLTDGMNRLIKSRGLYGVELKTTRYDTGDKLGFLKANVEFGIKHPQIGEPFQKYLKTLLETL